MTNADPLDARMLIAFITARLNDDEQVAQATGGEPDWQRRTLLGMLPSPWAQHSSRWSPKRVLVEVEAKREILGLCAARLFDDDGEPCFDDGWQPEINDARWNLRFLALPFVDHPDYDPSWAL